MVKVQGKRKRTHSQEAYLKMSSWKDAKRQQAKGALMGNLVKASFEEVSSTPVTFQAVAKERALAYMECYFLQEAIGNTMGRKPPLGHELEFFHRIKVALDHRLAAKKEAFRIVDYRMAFLLAGAKNEQGFFDAPSWPQRSCRCSANPWGQS